MRTLTHPLLQLEPQTAAHAPEMFAVLSDPRIYEFENSPPSSLAWLQARYARLEARISPDQCEQWLNWVIRLNSGEAIGYVQASVFAANGDALIAYELNSAFWGRGLAKLAIGLMLEELAEHYGVENFLAQLKRANARSRRLLERLGFATTSAGAWPLLELGADEMLMHRMPAEYSPDFKC